MVTVDVPKLAPRRHDLVEESASHEFVADPLTLPDVGWQ